MRYFTSLNGTITSFTKLHYIGGTLYINILKPSNLWFLYKVKNHINNGILVATH